MNDILPLSIGTLSEECINCGYFSFLAEHGRTKGKYCYYGKIELGSVNYPETLKNYLLGSHSDAIRTFPGVSDAIEQGVGAS